MGSEAFRALPHRARPGPPRALVTRRAVRTWGGTGRDGAGRRAGAGSRPAGRAACAHREWVGVWGRDREAQTGPAGAGRSGCAWGLCASSRWRPGRGPGGRREGGYGSRVRAWVAGLCWEPPGPRGWGPERRACPGDGWTSKPLLPSPPTPLVLVLKHWVAHSFKPFLTRACEYVCVRACVCMCVYVCIYV